LKTFQLRPSCFAGHMAWGPSRASVVPLRMKSEGASEATASEGLHSTLDNEEEPSQPHRQHRSILDVEPRVGTRLSTSFGEGSIEKIREYEGMRYCSILLSSYGTLSLPWAAVEALLKKQQKLSKSEDTNYSKGQRISNLTGRIRTFNPTKGWGFITCNEFEGDIFLHSKHLVGSSLSQYVGHFQNSQDGYLVKFDLDLQHRSKPQALNVRVADGGEQLARRRPGPAEPEAPRLQSSPSDSVPSALMGAQPEAPRRFALRMRGLPFSATASQVAEFFNGYGVRAEDVTFVVRADGSSCGMAVAHFLREDLALKALKERNMQHMGSRYIELFQASPTTGRDPGPCPADGLPASEPSTGASGGWPPARGSRAAAGAEAEAPGALAGGAFAAQHAAAARAYVEHWQRLQEAALTAAAACHQYDHCQDHRQSQQDVAEAGAFPPYFPCGWPPCGYSAVPFGHFVAFGQHGLPAAGMADASVLSGLYEFGAGDRYHYTCSEAGSNEQCRDAEAAALCFRSI